MMGGQAGEELGEAEGGGNLDQYILYKHICSIRE